MRGREINQTTMFSYVAQEDRIPSTHPLRRIKKYIDPILEALSSDFNQMYADEGRPSIPPEHLLRSLILQVLYTIRSERLLMEQLDYNLLFRWFVGLSMDDKIWDHSVFSKNRDRLLEGEIAQKFLVQVVGFARKHDLMSDEHFTVDGTMLEAWASMKSFQEKDKPLEVGTDDHNENNPTVDFHGQKRKNDTHQSKTDPEARLYRKGSGKEAKLCFMGHVLMENRHGLVIATGYTHATGTAEREEAYRLIGQENGKQSGRVTVGADKLYDTKEFVQKLREIGVTPHVAQNNTNRSSAIDERTTRHQGYAISQRKRKRIEEIFGWGKTVGLLHKMRHKGVELGDQVFTLTMAVFNLVRIGNILKQT